MSWRREGAQTLIQAERHHARMQKAQHENLMVQVRLVSQSGPSSYARVAVRRMGRRGREWSDAEPARAKMSMYASSIRDWQPCVVEKENKTTTRRETMSRPMKGFLKGASKQKMVATWQWIAMSMLSDQPSRLLELLLLLLLLTVTDAAEHSPATADVMRSLLGFCELSKARPSTAQLSSAQPDQRVVTRAELARAAA